MNAGRSIAFFVMVLAICFATRSARVSAFALHREGQRYEDIYYLPAASTLPLLSLGYHAALADALWCRSLVYFGEELKQRGPVKFVFTYTDAILALDPSFRAAYRWIATAAIYRPGALTLSTGLRAASYLDHALQRWPNDGELQWDYGSLLRFELAPLATDKAAKRQLWERAAPHLVIAAKLGAGPPWLALNSAELLEKLGRTDQAIRQLEELRDSVHDDETKQQIDVELTRLRSAVFIQAEQAFADRFEAERVSVLPYVSEGLFVWAGARTSRDEHSRFVLSHFSSLDQESTDAP